jgi:hypothetical protein
MLERLDLYNKILCKYIKIAFEAYAMTENIYAL